MTNRLLRAPCSDKLAQRTRPTGARPRGGVRPHQPGADHPSGALPVPPGWRAGSGRLVLIVRSGGTFAASALAAASGQASSSGTALASAAAWVLAARAALAKQT